MDLSPSISERFPKIFGVFDFFFHVGLDTRPRVLEILILRPPSKFLVKICDWGWKSRSGTRIWHHWFDLNYLGKKVRSREKTWPNLVQSGHTGLTQPNERRPNSMKRSLISDKCWSEVRDKWEQPRDKVWEWRKLFLVLLFQKPELDTVRPWWPATPARDS